MRGRFARWPQRSVVVCLAAAVLALAARPAGAVAEEASPSPSLSGSLSLTESPLVIAGSPEEAAQLQATQEAKRNGPEAVAAREESQTKFEGLDPEQAAKLAGEAFPRIVDDPAGGPPSLPEGQRILAYPTPNSAQLELPGGKHGVLESLSPIAISTSPTTRVPIDLALSEASGEFQSARSLVGTHIPKHLADGVSIPDIGVSLTPVDASGHPLAGSEGSLDGVSVLYANTQTDTDTLAKPTTGGFEIDALLCSVNSPEQLYFEVGMPSGAELVSDDHGGARVVHEGQPIADVPAPSATDAAGTYVPVQMNIVGSTLVLTVKHSAGAYEAPIAVDPNVYDSKLGLPSSVGTNWQFEAEERSKFEYYETGYGPAMVSKGSYNAREHDEFAYEAHGQASVMYIEEESEAGVSEQSGGITKLEFAYGATEENSRVLASSKGYGRSMERLCVPRGEGTCGVGSINQGNEVRYSQTATLSGTEGYGFWGELFSASVGVRQEKGPEASYNTYEPNLASDYGRQNVLYGSNGWLGEHSGAFEVRTHDPGLGVSNVTVRDMTGGAPWKVTVPILTEGKCSGVWCNPNYTSAFAYSPEMAEGENTIELCADNAANMQACTDATVKVDNTPPHGIKIAGLPEEGGEISAAPHQIKAEATDGTEPTPSSGIKSVEIEVDGKTLGGPQGYCPRGPCTAGGEWTINGESLGVGVHTLKVIAIDNAGNATAKELTFAVRNASPIALGPGAVDPITGQFTLTASDVSMTGVGGITRTYTSQRLATAPETPFGPQWSANVGTTQSLSKLGNGSVQMTGGEGRLTIFARNSKGEFESPAGDANLKLTAGESEGKPVYYLTDAATATTTKFILPSGSRVWVPAQTEGTTASGTTTYGYRTVEQPVEYSLATNSAPTGIATGVDGNLWIAQSNSTTVSKVTTAGAVVEYKLTSPFSCPNYIASAPNKESNLWFTDNCDHQIGKITTGGATTAYNFTSGVELQAITAGPDGNLWFAMEGVSKIGKITTAGSVTEYGLPSGSSPKGITAGQDGNLWFTDYGTNKIGKITTAGGITEYVLPSGSEPYNITAGPDGNLWFTDYGTNKIGKITTAGGITEYSLPSGSGPRGIIAGPGGALWFTEYGTSKIGEATTSGTVSEFALPEGSGPSAITYGPDGNVWYVDYGTSKVGKLTPVTEPIEELGPVPSGVSCGKNPQEVKLEELKQGCRALTFTYDEKMTIPGEGESEWGEYHGRLMSVSLTAYNPAPSSKKMETVAIAQYAYDKQGRLRAQWDPRISPGLKTIYGYDSEGHVTSLTPPGQESWAFEYGMMAGDASAGRLLKVTRAPASTALWSGEAPKSTGAPTLSGSPVVGVRMAASNGAWSGSPVAYGYQWEDCNSSGAECQPIAGASNPNYTPVSGDVGHALVVQVTATNGGGSVLASSAASVAVLATTGSHTQTVDSGNSVNAVSCVPGTSDCVVSDSLGRAFYATNVSTSAAASWSVWSGPGTSPSEAVDCPASSLCLLADGKNEGYGGNLYYATSLGGSWTLAYSPSYGVDAISCSSSSFCLDGQDNLGYFRYATSPGSTSWTLESQGSATMKGVFCLSSSFCAIADGAGRVHMATTTSQVESSSWTETDVDGSSALNGVACTSTTSCVAVDGAGNVLNLAIAGNGSATASKHDIDGTNSLAAITCTGATCVTVDSQGNVFVSINGGETWKEQYQLAGKLTSVSCSSSSLCATADAVGNVTALNPTGGATEGEPRPPHPSRARRSSIAYPSRAPAPARRTSAPAKSPSGRRATIQQKRPRSSRRASRWAGPPQNMLPPRSTTSTVRHAPSTSLRREAAYQPRNTTKSMT